MKPLMLFLPLFILLSACTKNTEYGACVGLDDHQDKKYEYTLSKKNIVIGTLFFQTLWVPLNVTFWNLYCPTDLKEQEPK